MVKARMRTLANVNNKGRIYSMSGRYICMTGEILDIYDDLCYIYLSLRRATTTSHGLIHGPEPNS